MGKKKRYTYAQYLRSASRVFNINAERINQSSVIMGTPNFIDSIEKIFMDNNSVRCIQKK